jgi:hypothetical protein
VDRIESELRKQGVSNPRELAIEQVAQRFHKDVRTIREYLSMLKPENKRKVMAKYKIPPSEKP